MKRQNFTCIAQSVKKWPAVNKWMDKVIPTRQSLLGKKGAEMRGAYFMSYSLCDLLKVTKSAERMAHLIVRSLVLQDTR